ncbi:MAG: hypothetical protein Q9168_004754 [Polycauliona sp. 1 TL-2023]
MQKDVLNGVEITLFPRIGTRSIKVRADVDNNIPCSIVQKSILDSLSLEYESCQEPEFTDRSGRTHSPIGRVDLEWQKTGFLLQNTETFYVVDSGDPAVELKHAGDPAATDNGVRPVGLAAQTPEQQKAQAQKKAQVDKERAEEKKRQEDHDHKKHEGGQASGK